jgi:hypothetical protein
MVREGESEVNGDVVGEGVSDDVGAVIDVTVDNCAEQSIAILIPPVMKKRI